MANNDWDDIDDMDEADGSDLVKKLRQQLKAANKRASEAEAAAEAASKKIRQQSVKDILASKGVNQKIARWVLADVEDPTEESVAEWLNENGEVFGIEPAGSDPEEPKVPQGMTSDDVRNLAAINQFVDTTRPVGSDPQADIEAKIASAQSPEELSALLGIGRANAL